jgi:hypothetical protein
MNTQRLLLPCFGFALIVLLLAACAAPAAPTAVVTRPTQQGVIPGAPAKTEAPAPTQPPAPTKAPAEAPQPTATQPAPQPTQPAPTSTGLLPTLPLLPTASPIPATPFQPTSVPSAEAPVEEAHITQVEWPAQIRLGESDVVRMSLIPASQSYLLVTEYPEHPTITQTVTVQRPPGYELFAVGRLDGVGFSISPQGDQAQYLPPGQGIAWRWSLTPRQAGKQRISVTLTLRWVPFHGAEGSIREVVAYSSSLDVRVMSFFGMSQAQAMFTGLVSLLFGGGLGAFALVIRPRGPHIVQSIRSLSPNASLSIELPAGISLSPSERALLQTLFKRYARLVIEQEFLSGYSGARTFLALPIRPDGRADAYTIAKIGESHAMQKEFANYETFVKDTLPPITARIQHPPITTSAAGNMHLAALQYTFIGEPGKSPVSLRKALLSTPNVDLLFKLRDTFGPNWWLQRRPYSFRLSLEYDRVLPTHLVVEPSAGKGFTLDGHTPPAALNLNVGDLVTLRNFPTVELRADQRSLALSGQPPAGHPPLRLRWLSTQRPEGACGRVVATRLALLRDYTQDFDLLDLPNPFLRLLDLLGETVQGSQSTIHGDLNLENVLVGPGNLVWLIDFAQTRDGHTLFDFAHLEAEIIAHILAPQIPAAKDYLTLLRHPSASPCTQLHDLLGAMHEIAGGCLFNPTQMREYRLALTLACLGALKYVNLDQHAKHLLYITAAYTTQEL